MPAASQRCLSQAGHFVNFRFKASLVMIGLLLMRGLLEGGFSRFTTL